MAQLNNARQWQRFAYPADVALETDFDAAEPLIVAALAVDLSLGGMQLLAANAPRVGAAISCKFPNDHSELQLRGFVRWSAPAPSPGTQFQARVGVEFEPLSSMARQGVQALISHAERAGELVRVQLPNWPFALQGVAVPSERGVRLHVPLPSIAQGSTIKFMSLSPETPLEGRVLETALTLCRKTQALELSMVLEPSEPARRRRYTVYDQPTAVVVSTALGPDRAAASPVIGKPRWHLTLIATALLLAGLAWFFATTRPVFHMTPHHVAVEPLAPRSEPRTGDRVSAPVGPRVPEAAAPVESRAAGLTAAGADAVRAAEEESIQAPDSAEHITPSDSAVPSTPEAVLPADDASTSDPSFSVNDEFNEVFVPVRGSLASLHTARWAEPSALVVDLPAATAALTHARYSTHTGCLLGLSVGTPRGTTQLRVYLSEKTVRYTTSESAGGLLIRVRCTAESSALSH